MITTFYKDYIEANTSLAFGEDLFIGRDPDSPDDMVRLSNESGFRNPYQNNYASDWIGLMVRVRGHMPWAEETMWELHNLIVNYGEVETDDFWINTTWCQGEPQQIEIDEDGRSILTAHYLSKVVWKQSTNRTLMINA